MQTTLLGTLAEPETNGASREQDFKASEMNKWWTQAENNIGTLHIDHNHIEELYARQIEGVWEYAVVGWRYKNPTLKFLFKENKITFGEAEFED